jgi:hypothetical protein
VQNLNDTILAQYANSPILMQLLTNMNSYVDPRANLANFYNQCWNIATAQGYGLDRIGRLVGVSRILKIPTSSFSGVFEFREDGYGTPMKPGGTAPFWSGTLNGSNFALSDSSFRTLIYVKAISNISLCSAPAMNQMLTNLYGTEGVAYCQELGNMQMGLVFEFALNITDFYILTQSKALSRPSGVLAYLLTGYSPTGNVFLFKEAGGMLPLSYAELFSGSYSPIAY